MELDLELYQKISEEYENKKIKYFRRDEVVVHNSVENGVWFIINKRVVDLTLLFVHHSMESPMYYPMKELLAYAGKDLSHFFSDYNCVPKTRITFRGNTVPILAATVDDVSKMNNCEEKLIPWYKDPKYVIGNITADERRIRIINTLIVSTVHMTVCEENTINDILEQYLQYNSNARNYLWKSWSPDCSRTINLKMTKTLTQNKLFKEEIENGLPPAIWLFYIDELTGYLDDVYA